MTITNEYGHYALRDSKGELICTGDTYAECREEMETILRERKGRLLCRITKSF